MRRPTDAQFRALFDPRGVLVAGASTHPGKFGFVSLHNILASGYRGAVFGTNLEAEEVLGVQTVADIGQLPDDAIDLVFVCTPASANEQVLRACAAKGIKAAFLTSAGYGEAGEAGRRAEAELVALADELGMLLAGPNGQGVVSTPADLCAQIVAPFPPAGRIAVASQSGNLVSSFLNYRPSDRRRHQPRRVRGQRRGGHTSRLSRVVRERSRDRPSRWRTSRESSTAARLLDTFASVTRRQAAGGRQGRRDRRRREGGGQPHRCVGRRRQGVRRRLPASRCHAVPSLSRRRSTRRPPSPRSRCQRVPTSSCLTTAGGWGVVTSDAIARAEGLQLIAVAGRPDGRRSTPSCRHGGAATIRSTAPAARPATPFPR